jgi:hypothetical protein
MLEPGQKNLSWNLAAELSTLLLKNTNLNLDLWNQFLTERKGTVSKDDWKMLRHFSESPFESYDPNDFWPVILDDFVEFCAR